MKTNNCNLNLKLFILNVLIILCFSIYLSHSPLYYQDRWILDGIYLPFILIVIIFFISVMLIQNLRYVTLLCAIFIAFLNLIPSLKYGYFIDTGDSASHYVSIKYILQQGFPIEQGPYSKVPGFHIFVASFILISNCSINSGLKYLLPIASIIYPLFICAIINKFDIEYTIKKYVVVSSVLLIINNYYIYGTTFASMLLLLLISLFLMDNNHPSFKVLIIISIFSIIISHGVTSFLLPILLLGPLFVLLITKLNNLSLGNNYEYFKNSSRFLPLIVVFILGWWMYQANFFFESVVSTIKDQFFIEVSSLKTPIPQKFFEIDILSKIKIFLIYHVRDFMLLLNSIIGILALFYQSLLNKALNKILYYYVFILSILTILFFFILSTIVTKFGSLEYRRYIYYGVYFAPFFTGISFVFYEKILNKYFSKNNSKFLVLFVLFFVFITSLIQFYPYQPLVPNVNSSEIQSNDQIMYFHSVNTVYRVNAIQYAEKHMPPQELLGTDISTKKQLFIFANESFYKHSIAYESPLIEYESPLYIDPKSKIPSLILLHNVGISGIYAEPVEMRTESKIKMKINNLNSLYSNGEYFLLRERGR